MVQYPIGLENLGEKMNLRLWDKFWKSSVFLMQYSNNWADSNQPPLENGGILGSSEFGGGWFTHLKHVFKPNQFLKLSKEALT